MFIALLQLLSRNALESWLTYSSSLTLDFLKVVRLVFWSGVVGPYQFATLKANVFRHSNPNKSLSWSIFLLHSITEPLIDFARCEKYFDSLTGSAACSIMRSSRQNDVTWCDSLQGKQVELSLARASRSQSRYALKSSTCEQVYPNPSFPGPKVFLPNGL